MPVRDSRYAIVTQADIKDAMRLLEAHRDESNQNGHSFRHSEPKKSASTDSETAN
jgi:hypothetical protein